jgi:thioesterase domain-containing protein
MELRLSLPRVAGRPLPASLREVMMTRAFHHAADSYVPRPLSVPIVLFTASERPPGLDHVGPDLGWEPLAAAGIDIRYATGTHDDLVREPHVGTLGQLLADALRDSLSAGAARPLHALATQ